MQHGVCAGFWARDERAQPCVQWEEAEEPQRRARLGDEYGEGGDGRYAGIVYECRR